MGKVEPLLRSEISAGGSRRSILEAEVTIPRGRPSGVYRLDRIGKTMKVGSGPLLWKGLPEALQLTFEVTREPADDPNVVEVAFVGD